MKAKNNLLLVFIFFLLISFTQKSNNTISKLFHFDSIELEVNSSNNQKSLNQAYDSLILQIKNQNRIANMVWDDRGPDNFGGRTRVICIDRNNNDHVFCGSVSGGLFETWNGGITWNVVPGFYENLRISSMCQTLDGTYYVGTGSSFDNWSGDGIWSSDDNGATWNQLAGSSSWIRVNEISTDGNISNKIWITGSNSTGGFQSYSPSAGFIPAPGMTGTTCQDCKVSPDGLVIIASRANGNFIESHVSNDGGATFYLVSGIASNQVPSSGNSRIEYAISWEKNSLNNWTIYASVALANGTLGGVYISEDNGNNWTEIALSVLVQTSFRPFQYSGSTPSNFGRGFYDQIISVVPGHPDHLLLGGVEMYKWKQNSSNPINGTWTQQTTWNDTSSTITYAHTEIHELDWDQNGMLYMGCDGGVYKSNDLGENNWVEYNKGLNMGMFYSVAFNKYNHIMGGTQGNGTLVNDYSITTTGLDFQKLPNSRDGFDCDFSQINPSIFIYSQQNGGVYRCDSFAGASSIIQTLVPNGSSSPYYTALRLHENLNDLNSEDSLQFISNQNYVLGDTIQMQSQNQNYEFAFIVNSVISLGDTVIIQDPIQSLLAVGSNSNVFLTRGALKNNLSLQWTPIFANVGSINCIEFSSDGNYMYVGGSTGVAVVKGLNTFYSPANDISGVTVTSISGFGSVNGIGVDPNNPDHIVIAAGNKLRECNSATTATSIAAFPDITSSLFDVPTYDAIIDYQNPNKMVMGTEFGLYATDDGGSTWTYQQGPGFVPVYAVRQQWRTDSWNAGVVYAGTFGRGIWSSNSFIGIHEQDATTVVTPFFTEIKTYPNPMNTIGIISFNVKERSKVEVCILDLTGKMVMTKNLGQLNQGENHVQLNVKDIAAGTYVVMFKSGNEIETGKLIVTH